ncbi:unnamed protein product [Protopolystoma xenopodis]|uniref:Uncharacterized protein n=1 Tax=Protopolystoma xenopodis TaxID=117903 RepID=A0A3S5A3H1_9PLAT|nr:unnamed protein product [Protopolystoma xenopodis]
MHRGVSSVEPGSLSAAAWRTQLASQVNQRTASRHRALGASLLMTAGPPHPFSGSLGLYPAISDQLIGLTNGEAFSNGPAMLSSNVSTPGNLASVQFEVPRPPALIRSDNSAHRATVGLIDLQPTYEYVTVPKRSPHAYLKAISINQSQFSMLPGQTNIYADNTFIGKVCVISASSYACDYVNTPL